MSYYVNPLFMDFATEIENLKPTPGYCLFIDIVESTRLKDRERLVWIATIYNAFTNITGNLFSKFKPLKSLGDELMFFIPEQTLPDETPLTLFDGLYEILDSQDPLVPRVRISVSYCKDAYDITFIEGVPDVYGKDIDLTGRLKSEAGPQELVMNEGFFQQVQAEYNRRGNRDQFTEVSRIGGPLYGTFKGFDEEIAFYRIIANH